MKKKMLMVLVAVLATAWMVGPASALTNDALTKALWHMDEVVVISDANHVEDDDGFTARDNDILLDPNDNAILVAPGYDGGGKCLLVDPNGEGMTSGYPRCELLWNYAWQTFKFEGRIASDDRVNNCYLFATYDQIGVTQQDADTDGVGEVVFYVKTWKGGIEDGTHSDDANNQETLTVYAEMTDSNTWQSVECSYELDGDGNGIMTIVTDVETVVVAQGIGPIAPHVDRIFTYIANRKSGDNLFQGKMDEVKISVFPLYLKPAAPDPKSDDGTTWGLWHMDSTIVNGLLIAVPDDDSARPAYAPRDNHLNLAAGTNGGLISPGYDGTGQCLQCVDPGIITASDSRNWNYSFYDTFQFEGWISSDNRFGNLYLYAVYDQIGVLQRDADSDGTPEIELVVKTWVNGIEDLTHADDANNQEFLRAHADMTNSNAWQHVECAYDLDYDGNGVMTVKTDLETVVIAQGKGGIAPHITRIFTYFANRKSGNNAYLGRIDEVKVSTAPQIACGSWGYYEGDFNRDCYVDKQELGDLGEIWLASTDPANPDWLLGISDQYFTFNIPHATEATATVVAGIDGVLSAGEWADAKMTDLFWPEVLELPHVGTLKYDTATHDDCGAEYYYKWDETYLYVAIQVYDDDVAFFHGYPYDHATLVLNVTGDSNVTAPECAFYNMYMDYPTYDPCCFNALSFDQAQNAVNAVLGAGYTADGWIFEAALKWSDCEGYVPAVGKTIGVGGFILDFDYGGDAVYESHTFLFDYGYGDTQAAVKPMLWHPATLVTSISCGEHGYLTSDKNKDCITNIPEFAIMAADWMKCTDPNPDVSGCDNLN